MAGATIQHLVVMATSCLGYVHPCHTA